MLDRNLSSRWTMADAGHTLRRLADAHRPEATLPQTRITATAFSPEPAQSAQPVADLEPAPREAPTQHAAYVEEASPPRALAPTRNRGSRRHRRAALIALALLLAVGGIALATTRLGGGSKPSSVTGEKSPKSSTKQDSASKNAQQSPSDTSTSRSSGSKEAFIRDYYAKAPGGSDEAWAMLAPEMQSIGHDRYIGFWRTIETVEVRDVQAPSDGNTVEVTLVYRTKNGRTSTERKREGLSTTEDGGYQIVSDVPAT